MTRERDVAARLSSWFARAARDLPWRRDRTAWGALVSELMLQQTQVSRVIERYGEFMARFPNAAALASASEQDVLAAWRGMGYYRRALHLHAAARLIVDEFDGELPRTAAELRRLPGVGRYTAGAIASIIFGQAEPIVDGNVRRVLARLHGRKNPASNWIWNQATRVVAASRHPGAVNEAMMELGATICLPRNPRCDRCPLANFCVAESRGLQEKIPAAIKPVRRRIVHHHCLLARRRGRVLMERRPAQGMWAGMWQTPTIESSRALRPSDLKCQCNGMIESMHRAGSFEHLTTHRLVRFHVFEIAVKGRVASRRWVPDVQLDDLPMSAPQRKILQLSARQSTSRRNGRARL